MVKFTEGRSAGAVLGQIQAPGGQPATFSAEHPWIAVAADGTVTLTQAGVRSALNDHEAGPVEIEVTAHFVGGGTQDFTVRFDAADVAAGATVAAVESVRHSSPGSFAWRWDNDSPTGFTVYHDTWSAPVVTALEGGAWVTLWSEYNWQFGDYDLKGKVTQADGSRSDVVSIGIVQNNLLEPSVVPIAGGGFGVVYQDAQEHTSPWGAIKFQQFDRTGSLVGPEVTIPGGSTFLYRDNGEFRLQNADNAPGIAALEDGGFAILSYELGQTSVGQAWLGQVTIIGADSSLVSSAPLSGPITREGVGTFVPMVEGGQIAALAGGGFVVAWLGWQDPDSLPYFTSLRAQVFDETGTPTGTSFLLGGERWSHSHDIPYNYVPQRSDDSSPAIAGLKGGGFVAVYSDHRDGFWVLEVSIVDDDGTETHFELSRLSPGSSRSPDVVALADGGFAVTWMALSGGPEGFDQAYLQVFDQDGTERGPATLVHDANEQLLGVERVPGQFHPHANHPNEPKVVELDGGVLAVTYVTYEPFSGPQVFAAHSSAKVSIFNPDGQPLKIGVPVGDGLGTQQVELDAAPLDGGGLAISYLTGGGPHGTTSPAFTAVLHVQEEDKPELSGVTIAYFENRTTTDVLGRVLGSDNVAVTGYEIVSGDPGADAPWFEIDNAGRISLTAAGTASTANDFDAGATQHTLGVVAVDAAGNRSAVAEVTLSLIDLDDAPVEVSAADDAFATRDDEVLTGNLFEANGEGGAPDTATREAVLRVVAINGEALPDDGIVVLPSGATLTVQPDGSFSYDPSTMTEPPAEGATEVEEFSYTVEGAVGAPAAVQLAGLDGSNGFVINGIDEGDASGRPVSAAGDVNGDGFDDIIVGARGADPNANDIAGESYVVFGTGAGFGASLELSALDGSNGFVINGVNESDLSGWSVSGAGDVNGDGFDDIIIGALFADPNGNSSAGESYVVFGSDAGFGASLELSVLNGSNGFVIKGIDANDRSGVSVSAAGDVNGDGFDDIVIGAPGADPKGNDDAGESYVVFGTDAGFDASLDLSALKGSNSFVINGIDSSDFSGWSVSGAGDVNGDGFDDIIVGAQRADPDGNDVAGESYVVFGTDAGFGASLDLPAPNGNSGFIINGIDGGGGSGYSVSGAGDVNGDGIDDIIVGAPFVERNGNSNAGESYVVFGAIAGFAEPVELSALNGSNGFIINGIDRSGQSGRSVSGAGDVNGDGIDDIIIGAPNADPDDKFNVGESYVVFGTDAGFGTGLNLSALDGSNGFVINGIDAGDFSGISVSGAGDVNGDGFDDIIIGAEHANPKGNDSAGESYVIFGRPTFSTGMDSATVAITVSNPDETGPVFTSASAIAFAENTAVGAALHQFAATDTTGPVTFHLMATGDDAAFSLTEAGVLSLNAAGIAAGFADFESGNTASLTVIARDGLGNATEQTVTVAATDVDEPVSVSASTLRVNEITGSADLDLSALVTLTDPDAGDTPQIIAASGEVDGAPAVALDGTTLTVLRDALPDIAPGETLSITVTLTVRSGPAEAPVDTTTDVTLEVLGENAAPSNLQVESLASPDEDHVFDGDLLVARLSFDDDGVGTNTLGIAGPDAGAFTLVGGDVFLKAGTALDFETQPAFNITFSLDDPDHEGVEGSVPFTLSIADVDDTADGFTFQATSGSVTGDEDTAIPLGLSLSLNDADGSETAAIRISGHPAGSTFSLGAADGSDWLIDASEDIAAVATLTMTPPPHFNGEVELSVAATVSEVNGGAIQDQTIPIPLTVSPVNDAPSGAVSISGTAAVGETLTVSNTIADVDGLGEISYQWLRDETQIDGASGADYTLGPDDVGARIAVLASYTDALGQSEAVASDPVSVAEAPSLVVTTAEDVVADDGVTSLREAIEFANSNPDQSDISFDAGLFDESGKLTIVLGGEQLTLSSDISVSGHFDDDGTPDVTIDADGASVRVFELSSGSSTLDGLKITGAAGFREAIYVKSGAELVLQDSSVANNSNRGLENEGNTTIIFSSVTDNHGSGIRNSTITERATLSVLNSEISGNQSDSQGAGINNLRADLLVLNSRFDGNISGGKGGSIFTTNGTVQLRGNQFIENSAEDVGGAIAIIDGTLVSVGNAFVGNRSEFSGGALAAEGGAVSSLNDVFYGNFAAVRGGAIVNNSADLNIYHGTITGNAAADPSFHNSGGIAHRGEGITNLFNTLAVGNAGSSENPNIHLETFGNSQAGLTATKSLLGDPHDHAPVAIDGVFSKLTLIDPDDDPSTDNSFLAGRLADNGGPIPTIALRDNPSNPALDAGSAPPPSEADLGFDVDGDGVIEDTPIGTDARGLNRSVDLPGLGGGSDIGAFELQRDEFNAAPELTVPAEVSVAENQTGVLTAFAFDADDEDKITFSISGDDADVFAIDDQTGELTFNEPPDFETTTSAAGTNEFKLVVEASDGVLTASQDVTVTLSDVNEAPTVALQNQLAALPEDAAPGTKVADIVPDNDALGVIHFTLSGDDAELFDIVNNELVLAEGADLDAAANPVLDVTVSVEDPSLSEGPDSAALYINVTNVNDAPVGGVSVSGTATVGETLAATNDINDADGIAGEITYRWQRGGVDTGVTGPEYTLSLADVGAQVRAVAVYTDAFGADEQVVSDPISVGEAPSLVVTTTEDVVADDGVTSLREAVMYANAKEGADTVTFSDAVKAEGLIRLTEGEIEITESITIDGEGAITISGDALDNDIHAAEPEDLDGDGVVDREITLIKESRESTDALSDGIDNDGDGLTDGDDLDGETLLDDNSRIFRFHEDVPQADEETNSFLGLTLTGGVAEEHGGAIHGGGMHIDVQDALIVGNSAGGHGGGVHGWGIGTIQNSHFLFNEAGGNGGGASLNWTTRSVTARDSHVYQSVFSDNSATDGGGLHSEQDVGITVSESLFNSNTAVQQGGGLLSWYSVDLSNSAIINNNAAFAGGLLATALSKLSQVIFYGNTDSEIAGAFAIDDVQASDIISTGNVSHSGYGAYSAGGVNDDEDKLSAAIILGNFGLSTNEFQHNEAFLDTFVFEGQNLIGSTPSQFDATPYDNVQNADPAHVFANLVPVTYDPGDGTGEQILGYAGGLTWTDGELLPTIELRDAPAPIAGQTVTLTRDSAPGDIVATIATEDDARATSFALTEGGDLFAIDNNGVVTLTGTLAELREAEANGTLALAVAVTNIVNKTSASVTVAISVPPANTPATGTVTIAGTLVDGETLTAIADLADPDGLPAALQFEWERIAAGGAVTVGTGATYTLTSQDVGATIFVSAIFTDLGGSEERITAGATAAIEAQDIPDTVITQPGPAGNVDGGEGRDVAILDTPADNVDLGGGDDDLTTSSRVNQVEAGAGDDTVILGASAGRVGLGDGNNTLTANGRVDRVTGGQDMDEVTINGGAGHVSLGDGDNTLTATRRIDGVRGGDDKDTVEIVNAGEVDLGNGENTLVASGRVDRYTGGDGDDHVTLNAGGGSVMLGDGNNTLYAAQRVDRVSSGEGVDTITLQDGGDVLAGGNNDLITSNGGWSVVSGEAGDDLFVFNMAGNPRGRIDGGQGDDAVQLRFTVEQADIAGAVAAIVAGKAGQTSFQINEIGLQLQNVEDVKVFVGDDQIV